MTSRTEPSSYLFSKTHLRKQVLSKGDRVFASKYPESPSVAQAGRVVVLAKVTRLTLALLGIF